MKQYVDGRLEGLGPMRGADDGDHRALAELECAGDRNLVVRVGTKPRAKQPPPKKGPSGPSGLSLPTVSINGSTGKVYEGDLPVVESEIIQVIQGKLDPKKSDKYQRFALILSWADRVRKLRVRANADVPDQAKIARGFGAEGIGLCRTEHMFFAEDRIPHVQAMILARDEKSDRDGSGIPRPRARRIDPLCDRRRGGCDRSLPSRGRERRRVRFQPQPGILGLSVQLFEGGGRLRERRRQSGDLDPAAPAQAQRR